MDDTVTREFEEAWNLLKQGLQPSQRATDAMALFQQVQEAKRQRMAMNPQQGQKMAPTQQQQWGSQMGTQPPQQPPQGSIAQQLQPQQQQNPYQPAQPPPHPAFRNNTTPPVPTGQMHPTQQQWGSQMGTQPPQQRPVPELMGLMGRQPQPQQYQLK
jgi:hypothetical protein